MSQRPVNAPPMGCRAKATKQGAAEVQPKAMAGFMNTDGGTPLIGGYKQRGRYLEFKSTVRHRPIAELVSCQEVIAEGRPCGEEHQ
jgi:hypothetical protein